MEQLNTQNQSEFDRLLEEMNKNLFNKEISDIVEVTYAYADLWNWVFFNKTLFWKFLWRENISWWDNIQSIHDEVKVKLAFKKQQVWRFKNQLLDLQEQENPRLQILLWTLDYLDKILDLTITWLPFEAEKAWISHNLSKREIENKVKRLEEIEVDLFGWNVRRNDDEVEWSYKAIVRLYESKKDKLTQEEQNRFLRYIQILKERFSLSAQNWKLDEEKIKTSEVLTSEISREDYTKIFKLVMGIYGIDKPVKIEKRSSIYDGEDYLGIPDSEWYSSLPLWRVLQLIQHEIETHYIIEKNNSQTLWKFRWWDNLPREEWTAKVAEWTLKWRTLDDFWIWWAIPDLLMWEILSWKDYRDYLELFSKMDKDEMSFWVALKDPAWLFLRRKRNYPLNYPWVQHKDTSYNRWELQVVKFLRDKRDVKDLYVWKVSFKDIWLTKEIIDREQIKLTYPLLIWELLQYVLLWNKLIENEFWDYIEKKYPFLNVRQEIANWSIERLTFGAKRQVVEILKLLQ